MGDAMLVVVHPIHAVFGNSRPRPKCLPEHIRSFSETQIRRFRQLASSPFTRDRERALKFFYFSLNPIQQQKNKQKDRWSQQF
jgi:hypothetical protein